MSGFKLLKGLTSKADEALNALKREKGTGAEFLRELEKTPGVKAQEIKDRGLDKALPAMGKTTKAEVKKVMEKNAPPKLEETVHGGRDNWRIRLDVLENRGLRNLSPAERDEYFRLIEQADELGRQSAASNARFQDYTLPGGENYREILLRLPDPITSRQNELKAFQAQMREKYNAGVNWGQFATPEERNYARSLADASTLPQMYRSSHWNEPNVLAHARVSDRTGPNGEKILHIEEIQSDWHQAGRKHGYQTPEKLAEMEELKKAKIKAKSELNEIQKRYEQAKESSAIFDDKLKSPEFATYSPERQAQIRESAESWGRAWLNELPRLMEARQAYDSIPDVSRAMGSMVPDAPFKKNWHELTMKRLLNYAAENGYDRVAITPGIEQAKRYDLSKQIDSLNFSKNSQGTVDIAAIRGGDVVIDKTMQTPEQLESLVGKELARKILDAADTDGSLTGLDLQVGGEGMKGFYDKILPDYLNSFGKPYGVSVGQFEMVTQPSKIEQAGRSFYQTPQKTVPVHTFDITPQMREEITKRGLPLYQQVGVPALEGIGAGAAAIGAAPDNQQVPQKVEFSDNPDAMRLELMQRK